MLDLLRPNHRALHHSFAIQDLCSVFKQHQAGLMTDATAQSASASNLNRSAPTACESVAVTIRDPAHITNITNVTNIAAEAPAPISQRQTGTVSTIRSFAEHGPPEARDISCGISCGGDRDGRGCEKGVGKDAGLADIKHGAAMMLDDEVPEAPMPDPYRPPKPGNDLKVITDSKAAVEDTCASCFGPRWSAPIFAQGGLVEGGHAEHNGIRRTDLAGLLARTLVKAYKLDDEKVEPIAWGSKEAEGKHSATFAFQSKARPKWSVPDYVDRLTKCTGVSAESLMLATAHFSRFAKRHKTFPISIFTFHRVWLAALLCAAKFHDDAFVNNRRYAQAGGVSLTEINRLEVEYLYLMRFNLYVSTAHYENLYRELIFYNPLSPKHSVLSPSLTACHRWAWSPTPRPNPPRATPSPRRSVCGGGLKAVSISSEADRSLALEEATDKLACTASPTPSWASSDGSNEPDMDGDWELFFPCILEWAEAHRAANGASSRSGSISRLSPPTTPVGAVALPSPTTNGTASEAAAQCGLPGSAALRQAPVGRPNALTAANDGDKPPLIPPMFGHGARDGQCAQPDIVRFDLPPQPMPTAEPSVEAPVAQAGDTEANGNGNANANHTAFGKWCTILRRHNAARVAPAFERKDTPLPSQQPGGATTNVTMMRRDAAEQDKRPLSDANSIQGCAALQGCADAIVSCFAK